MKNPVIDRVAADLARSGIAEPEIEHRGKHLKLHWTTQAGEDVGMIVSATPGDFRAPAKARSLARRLNRGIAPSQDLSEVHAEPVEAERRIRQRPYPPRARDYGETSFVRAAHADHQHTHADHRHRHDHADRRHADRHYDHASATAGPRNRIDPVEMALAELRISAGSMLATLRKLPASMAVPISFFEPGEEANDLRRQDWRERLRTLAVLGPGVRAPHFDKALTWSRRAVKLMGGATAFAASPEAEVIVQKTDEILDDLTFNIRLFVEALGDDELVKMCSKANAAIRSFYKMKSAALDDDASRLADEKIRRAIESLKGGATQAKID